jgi:hypothetical protein
MMTLKRVGLLLLFLGIISFIAVKLYDYRENKWYSQVKTVQPMYERDSVTVLCIVGTVHNPTKGFNADSLFEIINHFNPDIILTETDTSIYTNTLNEYRRLKTPLFAKIGRTLHFGKKAPEENETRAVRKYKFLYPAVEIRPFDYEGRNEYHSKHNILSEPDTVMTAIQTLFDKNELAPSHKVVWQAWKSINDTLDGFYDQTPFVINQNELYRITEKRQSLQYQGINQIVQEDQRLTKFRPFYQVNTDFWDVRNKTMADHILQFIKLYPKKRIMLLTGFMHKYYLLNELSLKQRATNFKVTEYWKRS